MYEFPSKSSKGQNLVIYLEGSGLYSVLGVKSGSIWTEYSFSRFVSRYFSDFATVVIPEKPFMKPGRQYHQDEKVLDAYTARNLVNHYARLIDEYLNTTEAKKVYLFGYSEGGLLAPAVYSSLKNRTRIDKIIIGSAGGMNQYDQFRTLADSYVKMPDEYREECRRIVEVRQKMRDYPDSLYHWYLGWPYKRWSSFFRFNSMGYYADINIPVLFFHGTADWSVPVESTRLVQKVYPDKDYTFWYINGMEHIPKNDKALNDLFARIHDWL